MTICPAFQSGSGTKRAGDNPSAEESRTNHTGHPSPRRNRVALAQRSPRVNQRRVNGVLRHEPDLELIRADDVADDQIIRAIVAGCGREARHCAALLQHNLVRVEQAGNLDGHLLTPLGGRGMSVVSATSCAMARLTPPSSWIRSAMPSTRSFCSL